MIEKGDARRLITLCRITCGIFEKENTEAGRKAIDFVTAKSSLRGFGILVYEADAIFYLENRSMS